MQTSNKRLNSNIEKQIFKMLYRLIADTKNVGEVEEVLSSLLSKSEMVSMVKRLAIAIYLDKGRSYENITNNLKVSSATIASVAEQMGDPGMQRAILHVKADEWGNEWGGKISRAIRKVLPV